MKLSLTNKLHIKVNGYKHCLLLHIRIMSEIFNNCSENELNMYLSAYNTNGNVGIYEKLRSS